MTGGSETQHYIPATNNPYATVTGITEPARDALGYMLRAFGDRSQVEIQADPRLGGWEGSSICLGGPVSNKLAAKILGTGAGSEVLHSFRTGERARFPVSFSSLGSLEHAPHQRPQYELVLGDRVSSYEDRDDRDILLLTSVPQFLSPNYGVSNERITIVSGLHGSGTRAVGLLLEDEALLAMLEQRTRSFQAWQAVIHVKDVNPVTKTPRSLGDVHVLEVASVDFDAAHERHRTAGLALDALPV